MISAVLDWSLLDGPLPWLVAGTGVVALGVLLAAGGRRGWRRGVPVALAVAAGLTAAAVLVVDVVWRPFPDPLPLPLILAVGVGLLGIGLAVARLRWWSPVAARSSPTPGS
ncbi:hypothetical protein [Pseudonocardia hydrocarbonoxydans]|nr:hypothetical protein [Pseudonocardia hydrocarbonoxydans]